MPPNTQILRDRKDKIMKNLSYKTLQEQDYQGYLLPDAPERILQFGGGSFLRGFADYFIDVMNEKVGFNSKVVVCQSFTTGLTNLINEQEGLYTLLERGFQDGQQVDDKRIISSINRSINPNENHSEFIACSHNPDLRFIICNTTEAGIVYDPKCNFEDAPANSFPGKLTQLLYHRFKHFGPSSDKGLIILACELIDDNGKELEKCVSRYAKDWNLGNDFTHWLQAHNYFCSTLVDRIVTGYPTSEAEAIFSDLGYRDQLLNACEAFALWVIEGPDFLNNEFPGALAGLPILVTDNHTPYKTRKVRILNGAHTSFVMGAYLAGFRIVRDCMKDSVISGFMDKVIYDEIIPTLDLPKEELEGFASSVAERFNNPFIDHELIAITLNSTSKWRARLLPSLKEYVSRTGETPTCIAASFAFYMAFFSGHTLTEEGLVATSKDGDYLVKDDRNVLEFFSENKHLSLPKLVHALCINEAFWGEDLSQIPGFEEEVVKHLTSIHEIGSYETMKLLTERNNHDQNH